MGDEDKYIPKTFEELFTIYSNFKIDPLDVDNQIYDGILLTQIDTWLEKADLLKKVFSTTETGMAWMKFKKWRLDFDEFMDLLKELCNAKELDLDEIKIQLTDAGSPIADADQPATVK